MVSFERTRSVAMRHLKDEKEKELDSCAAVERSRVEIADRPGYSNESIPRDKSCFEFVEKEFCQMSIN